MFLIIGLIAFSLTHLYLELDAGQPVHTRVATLLARLGWQEVAHPNDPDVKGLAPRKHRGLFRLLWQLQDCPYCLSTWVALFATLYVTEASLWSKVFWRNWWAACAIAWLAIAIVKLAQELIVELGARAEEREHQHEDG